VVTQLERRIRAAFSECRCKVAIGEGKPARITVAWHCMKFRWRAVKWELSAMMVPICVFMQVIYASHVISSHSWSFMVIDNQMTPQANDAKQMTDEVQMT
jgi:hypothetical protein